MFFVITKYMDNKLIVKSCFDNIAKFKFQVFAHSRDEKTGWHIWPITQYTLGRIVYKIKP